MKYDHVSAFFWKSKLSDERKAELVAWAKSLPKNQQDMLEDLIQDTADEAYWNALTED